MKKRLRLARLKAELERVSTRLDRIMRHQEWNLKKLAELNSRLNHTMGRLGISDEDTGQDSEMVD